MNHWNENIMIVVNCQTTGPDAFFNEICQFSALLLNSSCDIHPLMRPFNVYIKPSCPEAVAEGALTMKKMDMLVEYGVDSDYALDTFTAWLRECPFAQSRGGGRPAQAFALGYDLGRIMPFIVQWFGRSNWDEFFHPRSRDLLATSTFINDCAGMAAGVVPFSKNELPWLATVMKVDHYPRMDAIQEALVIAKTYSSMIKKYGFNRIGL
jgi:hypothetical protein